MELIYIMIITILLTILITVVIFYVILYHLAKKAEKEIPELMKILENLINGKLDLDAKDMKLKEGE